MPLKETRVFESALGYNPTNADVLAARIQEGVLSVPAKVLQANNYGQTMAVDMPILGVNGETAIVRTGWMYETDALVPRLTTLFVKRENKNEKSRIRRCGFRRGFTG